MTYFYIHYIPNKFMSVDLRANNASVGIIFESCCLDIHLLFCLIVLLKFLHMGMDRR